MARLAAVFVLGVAVLACVRESPEKARERAAQEELKRLRAFIEQTEKASGRADPLREESLREESLREESLREEWRQ